MTPRQTRIFVLPAIANEHFAENVVGKIIRPLLAEFPSISAFWFSRYGEDRNASAGDCDIAQIPPQFEDGGNFRSIRFRFWVEDDVLQPIDDRISALTIQHGFAISDVRPYNDVADLAWDRFLEGQITPQREIQRRDAMRAFLHSSAILFLEMLEGPDIDGNCRLTRSASGHNPHGSTFESIHHLFCNMTNVTTTVYVPSLEPFTRMYPQQGVGMVEKRVRF